jgi:DNA (cytosine-5)-methyltransferase 1
MKLRLLDLCCKAGGAGMGYHRAGFEVVGVDIEPQPDYPFPFCQADALIILRDGYIETTTGRQYGLSEFDVIHASPPCQGYSTLKTFVTRHYEKLVTPFREALLATGKPYIMENVVGAPLDNPLMLCGSMFGLKVIRHRLFECRPPIWFPPAPCQCKHLYTHSSRGYSSFKNGATAITVAGYNYPLKDGLVAMGIDWMKSRDELSEAIPPAYTEFIGKQMIALL